MLYTTRSRKKKLFVLIILGLLVFAVIYFYPGKKIVQEKIPRMGMVVINENTDLSSCCGQSGTPYQIDFVKIKSIGFATDNSDLYIKYNLGGRLPKNLQKYNNDQLQGLNFYMNLDENYYSADGSRNALLPEANLIINFYGDDKEPLDSKRVKVDGDLIAGGPGYEYFVVRYPYRKLLVNQNGPYVVFSANSILVSRKYASGASKSMFKNQQYAADKNDSSWIKIPLSLKDEYQYHLVSD